MALRVMPAGQMAESRDWICSCTNNYRTKCFIFFSNPGWQTSLKISKWMRTSRIVGPICFGKVYLNVHCTLRSMILIMSVQQLSFGDLKRTTKNYWQEHGHLIEGSDYLLIFFSSIPPQYMISICTRARGNIFINDLEETTECTFITFAEMTSSWGDESIYSGQGCHPEGPWQAGGMGQQEPYGI